MTSGYNPAWNDTCPSCRSATRYSGGLHHCVKCAYSFTGRRPPRQNHPA
jgi:ribosomal protein L37AE/L43A